MNEHNLTEVIGGVLKIDGDKKGPEEIIHNEKKYYRFMDCLYTETKDLDQLELEQVLNVCRARLMYPQLINNVNSEVREVFRELARSIWPASLLEIGAGHNPLFGPKDKKPGYYILADADPEVVGYHTSIGNKCYEFSDKICNLPELDKTLEMAIAIFVLHFPFHKNQLEEIWGRLKPSGVMVANVYRRDSQSREDLTEEMKEVGFKIIKIQDGLSPCIDHEYWVIGKDEVSIKLFEFKLKEILKISI